MPRKGTILVGTVGQGVFRSADEGASWGRAGPGQGMHSDCVARYLAVDPAQPSSVFAGTDQGLYRSEDAGGSWKLLDTPMNGRTVWNVAIDESKPGTMIAGTGTPSRPGFFRSTNAGDTWQEGKAEIAETCPAVGVPRPTAIALDPMNGGSVWAGLEVDGVRHSKDGGQTWEKAALEIRNPDVHNIVVTAGPPKRIIILVNDDVWTSDDDGASWEALGVKQRFAWHYPRGVAVRPDDPRVVFLTLGDTTPGRTGAVMRSQDAGESWEALDLPGQPNSAMWTMCIPKSNPDLMFAASRYGYLYRSQDGGDSWTRLWREFSEVSSIAWLPE
jgi:photosystem II stability/assembly factor-like uncharacterized protein